MKHAGEELKLGAGLAQEFGLDPGHNSFTSPHPNAYYFGVFLACTNRPLPGRDAARRMGAANGDHAYEVLKMGFAQASDAMGRPVLTLVQGGGKSAKPAAPAPWRRLREAVQAKAPPKPSRPRQMSLGWIFTLLLAVATLLTLLQNRQHWQTQRNLPPLPGAQEPADAPTQNDGGNEAI